MTIREYFYGEYEKTVTKAEWEKVERYEKAVFEMYENDDEKFERWAKEKGIDLTVMTKYGYSDLTMWAWDMEE